MARKIMGGDFSKLKVDTNKALGCVWFWSVAFIFTPQNNYSYYYSFK